MLWPHCRLARRAASSLSIRRDMAWSFRMTTDPQLPQGTRGLARFGSTLLPCTLCSLCVNTSFKTFSLSKTTKPKPREAPVYMSILMAACVIPPHCPKVDFRSSEVVSADNPPRKIFLLSSEIGMSSPLFVVLGRFKFMPALLPRSRTPALYLSITPGRGPQNI